MTVDFELEHRKKWLDKPVRSKRYIRGIINNIIKEKINSRNTGERTTSPSVRLRALNKTGGKCYLCLRQYTQNTTKAVLLPRLYFSSLQIDHIMPFSKFGPNSISNYMPICSRCNNKKSDLSLAEFRAGVRKRNGKRHN